MIIFCSHCFPHLIDLVLRNPHHILHNHLHYIPLGLHYFFFQFIIELLPIISLLVPLHCLFQVFQLLPSVQAAKSNDHCWRYQNSNFDLFTSNYVKKILTLRKVNSFSGFKKISNFHCAFIIPLSSFPMDSQFAIR